MTNPLETWEYKLEEALALMLKDPAIIGTHKFSPETTDFMEHLSGTPARLVKSFKKDFFKGVAVDPKSVLTTLFSKRKYDEVIIVSNIHFTSFCAHHLLPFIGQVHFGYMPSTKIVGLSKIPRLVDALSRRLQVQENLTEEIADVFYDTVQPEGCGVVIEAMHTCMSVRGVEKQGAIIETTALRGRFKDPSLKAEFLSQISPRKGKI